MIDSFMGKYRFLSNFHESPLEYGGLTYRNSEAAYQAQKLAPEDIRHVFTDLDGKCAKKASRAIILRPDWEQIKVRVMSEVLHAKFAQSPELQKMLLETCIDELVEGNYWHDDFWGVCNCAGKKPGCGAGAGRNMLGKLLMAEREYWAALLEMSLPPALVEFINSSIDVMSQAELEKFGKRKVLHQ